MPYSSFQKKIKLSQLVAFPTGTSTGMPLATNSTENSYSTDFNQDAILFCTVITSAFSAVTGKYAVREKFVGFKIHMKEKFENNAKNSNLSIFPL